MDNFRENYFVAREIVARELKEKYNLVESYREYDCLTLDSTANSIHLTFVIPEGDEVYITEKGKGWFMGKSFKDLLSETHPNDSLKTEAIKQIFKGCSRHPHSYKTEEIESTFRAKLIFLQDSFYEKFS